MSLGRVTAAILAFALVLHAGCDFWCHHQDAATSALQKGATAPCHGTTDSERPSHKQHPSDNAAGECIHPQAADDNLKLKAKVVKASPLVTLVPSFMFENLIQPYDAMLGTTHSITIQPSGPPTTILRI